MKRKHYAWRPISDVYRNYKREGVNLIDPATAPAEVVPMATPVTVSDVMATMAEQEPNVPHVTHEDASQLMKDLEAMSAYHNV